MAEPVPAEAAASVPSDPTPSPLSALETLSPTTLLISLLLPLLFVLLFFVRSGRNGGGGRGRSLLLFGPVGAGKSALYHQLRFGRVVPTVSSMEPTEASFVPQGGSEGQGGGRGRAVHAVDMPGTGRLRSRLIEEAASAAALVCVLDGTQLSSQAREAAGMLFEVLSHEAVMRRKPALLVTVNKRDCAGTATPAVARRSLEQEIQRVRLARITMGDTSGRDKTLRGIADDSQGPFSFDQLDQTVSFVASSATKPDVVAILDFIQKHVS
jgi:signal recognition particle receptor subunit beta